MSGVELSEVELSLRSEKWGRRRFEPVWSEAGGGGRGTQDPPKRPQEYTQRPYEVASLLPVLCCSSRLNHVQFIIQLCIGSSQETIKNIQELSKTNILEPPSFQASLPLSLQVPAAKRLGGIREAQTIMIIIQVIARPSITL